jgi:DNA-directed RNA polymerase subunit delta
VELEKFKDTAQNELSMIEVAHEILEQHGDVMPFADLTNQVQTFLGKSDEEIRERLSQFYTDLNIDGSFISLGDNLWGLRSWYPYDSIDEAVIHVEDDEDEDNHENRRQKVNAFMDDESDEDNDDVIDYDDTEDAADSDDDFAADDSELKEYSKDLSDIDNSDDAADDELPDGIEGQLSELTDDDLDDDE